MCKGYGGACIDEVENCMDDITCSPLMNKIGPGDCFDNENCTLLWKCR